MTAIFQHLRQPHFAVSILLLATGAMGVADDKVRFRTGKEFEKSLAETIKVSSISMPLQAQLDDLTQSSGLAIHRDRRIDPRTPISLETDFTPRVQVLGRISDSIPETSIFIHGNLLVLGPSPNVHRLPVLIDQTRQSVRELLEQEAASKNAEKPMPRSWDTLAEPRQILVDAATTAGLKIANPEAIPHDVWAASALPALGFSDLSAILLNEFDLILEADKSKTELIVAPIPTSRTFTLRYAVGTGLKSTLQKASEKQSPQLAAKWATSSAEISGTIEQHAAFHILLTSLRYQNAKSTTPASRSLRKMAFQLQEGRMTAGQLVENLQKQNLVIEILAPESPSTKTALSHQIHIQAMSKPLPASEFFERLFGEFFTVQVTDDKVILLAK